MISKERRNNMQNVVKVLADTLLVDLFNKNSKGADISKKEFDVMMEAYKKDYENRIDSSNQLEPEQKKIKATLQLSGRKHQRLLSRVFAH